MNIKLAAALTGALMLTGCTIQPLMLTDRELTELAQKNREQVSQSTEPLTGKITLYEAMARALKYNLDHKVEMMNEVVARKRLALRSADMLPQLVTNAGYFDRDNSQASYSYNLVTRRKSTQATSSTENGTFVGDASFSWHILDFGLSYIRAQQAADEALIAEERRRKIINRIMEDVRVAYWRAVSADRLLSGFQGLRKRVGKALGQSKSLYRSGSTSPVTALSYQRELIGIKKQIHRLERELRTAKIQLAALMNVDPGSTFSLHVPKRRLTDLAIQASGEEMVTLALENRPELREVAYEARANAKETKAALLEILPGISVFAGGHLDSNDLLYNASWVKWGAKVGWNLMKVFAYPARKGSIEARQELLRQRSLATTMAIMTQVYVARARYLYLRRSAQTASEYYNVQRRLRDQVRQSVHADVASEQTLIREEMNTLVAAIEFDLAYADLQNAFAAIYASVGADPIDESVSIEVSVKELAEQLQDTWRRRGDRHL